MTEFQKKDECCIIDLVISNIIALQEAHPPVLHFDHRLSFLPTGLTQREDAITIVWFNLNAS